MINILETLLKVIILGNGINDVPIEDTSLIDSYYSTYLEIRKHHESYTRLLNSYIGSSIFNIVIKILFKITFFVFAIYIWHKMLTTFIDSSFFALNLMKNSNDLALEQICVSLMGVVLPTLISLITAFLVIPKIIAKYLFNPKEENSLLEIIKSLQIYDYHVLKNKIEPELQAHDVAKQGHEGNNNITNKNTSA